MQLAFCNLRIDQAALPMDISPDRAADIYLLTVRIKLIFSITECAQVVFKSDANIAARNS
jgi:hypothetical protein